LGKEIGLILFAVFDCKNTSLLAPDRHIGPPPSWL